MNKNADRIVKRINALINEVKLNKIKYLRLAIYGIYFVGVFFLVILTIRNYHHAESMEKFKLLLFRNFIYFMVHSIFFLFILLCSMKIKLEKKFAVFAFLFGICYMFVMTPLSIPDERFHYQASYSLSNRLMFNSSGYGDVSHHADIWSLYSRLGHRNLPEGYLLFIDAILQGNLLSESNERMRLYHDPPLWTTYFLPYLPQSLGITFARLINGNFLLLFYMARLFNLIFFVLFTYFAVKKLSSLGANFSITMFLIGIMPMVLHQAASISYDTFIFSIAFLLIAYILFAVNNERKLSKNEFICIFILSVLIAPFRLIYLPLCFLCLLIPKERFESEKQALIAKVVIIASSILILLVFNINTMLNESDILRPWATLTLTDVFNNPFGVLRIILRTVGERFAEYFLLEGIGLLMSGRTLRIPTIIPLVLLIVLLLSTINYHTDDLIVLTGGQKLFSLVCIAACCFLAFFAMLLFWTPYGSLFVEGIQGRYFIPLLPLFFAILKNRVLISKKEIGPILMGVTILMQCVTLAYIVTVTVDRY